MPNYTLQVVNNSTQPWTFYVYQTPPEPSNSFSTVWLCSPFQIMPEIIFTFTWVTDYSLVWGQVGQVIPGVTFNAAGMVTADPQAANSSTFTAQPFPSLSSPVAGPPPLSLVINADGSVLPNQFAVGIGMSGSTTCIVNAAPNVKYAFSPDSSYWIAASMGQRVGTVLDLNAISMNSIVAFPPGVYELTCTLNQENWWSIVPNE